MIRAWTTYPAGPRTGEILARKGWDKVVCTTNVISVQSFFFGARTIFIRAVPKTFCRENRRVFYTVGTGLQVSMF